MTSSSSSSGRCIKAVACALVVCALWPAAVVARGEGIKAGPGRIHLGLDLDLVYDTNPTYRASDPIGDLILRVRPGLTLDFPSDMVSLLFNARAGYDYYTGVVDSRTTELSSVVGEGGLTVGFNPKGVFAVFLEDHVTRTGDPRYTSLSGKFDRTDNEAKLRLQIRPPGGALQFDVAYGFFLDWFDGFPAFNSYAHRCYFSGKWKFFPKTALSLDFDADIRRYLNSYADGSRNPDINGIRATLGLIGQITTNLAVIAKVGYGDTLLSGGRNQDGTDYAGGDFRSAIAQVELSLRLGTTFLQLGYQRGFQPVINFAFFGQDRLYLRFQQQLFGRLNLGADFAFDMLAYGAHINQASGARDDYLLSGGASVDYLFLDWLSVGLAYQFLAMFTDWVDPLSLNGQAPEYQKHAVILSVKLDY